VSKTGKNAITKFMDSPIFKTAAPFSFW